MHFSRVVNLNLKPSLFYFTLNVKITNIVLRKCSELQIFWNENDESKSHRS
jgi:hypothetical protein